ncbi:MAG: hypothetical protein OXN86_00965 [Chloroflexota bacterium]|nr:hypothetical protein [Chloroflexota bacterium]
MRTISSEGAAARWMIRLALVTALLALLVSLTPALDAQERPPGPQVFFGKDATAYAGSEIKVFNQAGVEISSGGEGTGIIGNDGNWWVQISLDDATRAKLRIVSASGDRETELLDLIEFDLKEISIRDFSPVSTSPSQPSQASICGAPKDSSATNLAGAGETLSVRIIARRAADGRIEFGMRGPDGEDILPRARFFPADGPGHSRYLRSTPIDFGGGFQGRIIACHVEADGRTEFGFRVAGYDDIFPRARLFPATGPDHNRFLRSSVIEIARPR